jgi:low temperature requirement protein LtrA
MVSTSLRQHSRVTNTELFYDLVYVFAVTQLSHVLVTHPESWFQTAVLLAMVWQIWVYTTWMTNYLDPDRTAMRIALLGLMFASLVLAASIPDAFGSRGWVIAIAYVVMQVGRGLFIIWALRGEVLQLAFVRITAWCALGAVPILLGAVAHGHVREGLWLLGVAVELGGAAIGFHVPGIGRSATNDWTIDGGHFAERCQAFVLIALGESVVVTGARLSALHATAASDVAAFVLAFLGVVGLWWIYFDRAAEDSAEVIAASDDPGRLGRNAFHWVHPLIVGGIIVSAAADEVVIGEPTEHGTMTTSWLVLGGVALFLAGHAVFKAILWRTLSWPRIVGVVVLLACLPLGPHVAPLLLGLIDLVVVLGVIVADRMLHPSDRYAAPHEPADTRS